MPLIETLLDLMLAQQAERLVLVGGEVPYLLKADETIELSMPALQADLLVRISLEIIGAERAEELADRPRHEGVFQTADGAEFNYHISSTGPQRRVELFALGSAADAEPAVGESRATGAVTAFDKPQPEPATTAAVSPQRSRGGLPPDPELLAAIDHAVGLDASDIFLSSGRPSRMRRTGAIRPLEMSMATAEQILGLLPDEEHRREFEQSGSVDLAVRWELPNGSRRFRINVFRHLGGVAAALRPVRERIPELSELGLPESFLDLAAFSSGLVLVTGASGSGKSTTLTALIDHINRSQSRHIITIEDPVEFEYRDSKALIHQREVGSDVESFSAGLRAALRENPDVILLGELRDLATISAALTAAETGHLVFGTLHTGSATAAISRIIDVFPGYQQAHVRVQLAASLRVVVSQRLIPSRSGRMVPAVEKMLVTPAVAAQIREGHEHHMRSAMQTGRSEGMITLERSLASLVRKGVIGRETAVRHASDRQALEKLLD